MILDAEEFRLWLVAKEPDELVGDLCQHSDSKGNLRHSDNHWQRCPIEQYASEFGRHMSVSRAYIWVDRQQLDSPEWVSEFTPRIDDLMMDQGQPTAKQALTILDDVLTASKGGEAK